MPHVVPHTKVLVGVLAYINHIEEPVAKAMEREFALARAAGFEILERPYVGDCIVPNARNGCVAEAIHGSFDELVFWDWDVEPEEGALLRLLRHPVEFVAGVYRKKGEPEVYPLMPLAGSNEHPARDPDTGLMEVAAVPAGFMRLSRSCLKRMIAWYSDREYDHINNYTAWALFDHALYQRLYWGEDAYFCKRYRDIGQKVWLDPDISMTHWGYVDPLLPAKGRIGYSGRFADWLQNGFWQADIAKAEAFIADYEMQRGAEKLEKLAANIKAAQSENAEISKKKLSEMIREANIADTLVGVRCDDLLEVPVQEHLLVGVPLFEAPAATDPTDWSPDADCGSASIPETVSKPHIIGQNGIATLTCMIPTRGRPQTLRDTVAKTFSNIGRRTRTRIMVAIDEDDEPTLKEVCTWPHRPEVVLSIKPREDTIAAKWNRAIKCAPADAYVQLVDYAPVTSRHFDEAIIDAVNVFPDEIGVVCTELANLSFPKTQIVTAKLVDIMGHFYVEHFPYWFVDHWLDDISKMIGRLTFAPVDIDNSAKPPTMEFREPGFWGTYYDNLWPERERIAHEIFDHPDFLTPKWEKAMLRRYWPNIHQRSRMINDLCRRMTGGADVASGGPRYQRVKDRALAVMSRRAA